MSKQLPILISTSNSRDKLLSAEKLKKYDEGDDAVRVEELPGQRISLLDSNNQIRFPNTTKNAQSKHVFNQLSSP